MFQVAVYSENDASSMHTEMTGEAYNLGAGDLTETYLDIDKIVHIAKQSGCDAIHPGYGFLAENPDFAKTCDDIGIKFIGPSPEVISLMGDKIAAKKTR